MTVAAAATNDALASQIAGVYNLYGGRNASADEIGDWSYQIRYNGKDLTSVKNAVIDVFGAPVVAAAIDAQYRTYGGRAASSAEIGDWSYQIRYNGKDLTSVKNAVIDVFGAPVVAAAIDAQYRTYGGRAASSAEIGDWSYQIRYNGKDLTSVKNAVIDVFGAPVVAAAIDAQYRTYGGRAASSAEIGDWSYQIRYNGKDLTSVKNAVIDVFGAPVVAAAIDAQYRTYGGRAASSAEIGDWSYQIRYNGKDLTSVKNAVIDAPTLGGNYLSGVISQTLQAYGGRAPVSSETAVFIAWLRDSGTVAGLSTAVVSDLGHDYWGSQLNAYLSAHSAGTASEGDIQALLGLLRQGSLLPQAETTILGSHGGDPGLATTIYDAYAAFIGRAPTLTEYSSWTATLASSSTPAATLRASLLPSTDGQAHLAAQITSEFQQWGGRTPTSAELATWKSAIQDNGAVPDSIRVSILGTSLGQARASGAITSEYQEYLGRAPTAAELQASLATLATTHDYAATHQAVFTAPDSILRFYDTLHSLYTGLLGHDYASADQSAWFDQIFFKNATYATMRATLMLDPTSVGAHLAGTSAADTITIHGATGETTISNFNAAMDKVKLDTAVYGGTNLLDAAHAREVMSTDGVTPNVLITIDANDHILLHGVNLAELSASNFLFG